MMFGYTSSTPISNFHSLISWRVFICNNSPCSLFCFKEESYKHAVWQLSFVTFKNGLRINVLINTLWWLTACFTLKSRQPCIIERSASFHVVLITKLTGRQGCLSLNSSRSGDPTVMLYVGSTMSSLFMACLNTASECALTGKGAIFNY